MTLLESLQVITAVLLAGAVLWSLAVRARERRVAGDVLNAERGSRLWRLAVAVPAVGAAVWLALDAGVVAAWPELALLLGGALLAALRPSQDDRISGATGVRRGWHVIDHADLEEWRLIGEHLRFRLAGEWTAVPLSIDRQDAVRARLESVAPERESGFGHGTGRPAYDPAP